MKVIIDISQEDYQNLKAKDEFNDMFLNYYEKLIIHGTPIPNDVTNGNMIKVMFPNAKIERGLYGISGTPLICLNLDTRYDVHEMSFVEDWWNAPYKKEVE